MKVEEINIKIKIIEQQIEQIQGLISFNKKDDKVIIFCSIVAFIALLIPNIEVKGFDFIYTICISYFTTSTYCIFDKMRTRNIDNKSELKKLHIDLMYYRMLLDDEMKNNSN